MRQFYIVKTEKSGLELYLTLLFTPHWQSDKGMAKKFTKETWRAFQRKYGYPGGDIRFL